MPLLVHDIEYLFPSGWSELWGVANRGDYDLKAHATSSKKDLRFHSLDDPTDVFFPYVIEPALGLDRLFYALLLDAYREETINGETRVVLGLSPTISPFKVAIMPLSKKEELTSVCMSLYHQFKPIMRTDYDLVGSIGKRYRRQDEIGTPYCIVVDFDSLVDHQVTIRHRDTMKQIRVPVEGLANNFDQIVEQFEKQN